MAGPVGLDGVDADGHVYGFLRGKGRGEVGENDALRELLTPDEESGPMPAPPDPED